MLTLYDGAPIAPNQRYLSQVQQKGYHLFPGLKNGSIYASTPNGGIPVYLAYNNNNAYSSIIKEWIDLSEEFIAKAGL
jgi:chromosome partitioning protein